MKLSFKSTILIVVFFHMAFLLFLGFKKRARFDINPKKQNVLVSTIKLKNRPPAPPKNLSPASCPRAKRAECLPKEKENNLKPSPPKPKKKAVKKNNTPKKLNPSQIAKLQKAKEALSKIDLKKPNEPSKNEPSLTTDDYIGSLSEAIQSLLTLPEYGAVKIKLTLKRNGTVKCVEVINSESKINQKAIAETLKKSKFSSFGNHFSGESEHTFVIVLSNDI